MLRTVLESLGPDLLDGVDLTQFGRLVLEQ